MEDMPSGYKPKWIPTKDDFLDRSLSIGMDPLLWRQYLMDERAHLDYLANLEYERKEGFKLGFKEGFEEGLRKGMEQKAIEIAKKLRAEELMTD